MDRFEGIFNSWKYSILAGYEKQPIIMVVKPASEITFPNTLCKYFTFSDYNLTALEGRYFYGSHPYDLNDPFDLNKNLLDRNLSKREFRYFP